MDEHNYNETTVRFYDVLYDELTGIMRSGKERADMYLEEISAANGPVLEAGAGTGKIFVPALKSGADIYGIDKSPLMYEKLISKLAEEERFRVSLQDIRDFRLDKKFSLVISPFRVFQHLLTVEDQLKALSNIYEHMQPGGKLIFDLFRPDLSRLHSEVNEVLEFEGEYLPGKKVRRYYSVKPEYLNQVQHVTFKYVWEENGGEKISEYYFPMRYYFRFEIENLVGRTPFKLEKIYGSFKKEELNNNSADFIVVCRK